MIQIWDLILERQCAAVPVTCGTQGSFIIGMFHCLSVYLVMSSHCLIIESLAVFSLCISVIMSSHLLSVQSPAKFSVFISLESRGRFLSHSQARCLALKWSKPLHKRFLVAEHVTLGRK